MIRPAVASDEGYVLAVRNLPDARASSLDTREITEDEHTRWWADCGQAETWIIEEPCDVYIGDVCPAGYVRASLDGYVSIAVTAWARGRGVATQALREVMALRGQLVAIVQERNGTSRRLFARCGFRPIDATVVNGNVLMRYEWSTN